MKKSILLTVIHSFLLLQVVSGQTKKEKATLMATDYQVECVGNGMNGSVELKVWGDGRKADAALLQAKRNAVHAVLFKGVYAGNSGCSTKPICSDPGAQLKNEEYFDSFFADNGKFLNFISVRGEGVIDREKIDNKRYRVSTIVIVMTSALRKELEAAGIIKSFGGGF